MTFQIASLEPSYLDHAAAIHVAAFSSIGVTAAGFEREVAAPGTINLAAVDSDGKVLGYALLTMKSKSAYLSWFAVDPAAKRKGVGAALLKAGLDEARARGAQSVSLDSRNRFRDALHFYIDHGFDIVGTWLNTDGDLMIKLRKSLGT